jgi:DNA-binding NarL/FixJ family response regulator
MDEKPIHLVIIEDQKNLKQALIEGFTEIPGTFVVSSFETGEDVLNNLQSLHIDVLLMDIQLGGKLDGVKTAMAIRREYPRMPVVFYSIQDDDQYYREFLKSGILSHYAYIRKSSFLLPRQLLPILKDTISGKSYIEPEIEARVQAVRQKDSQDPMNLLEPAEQEVAKLISRGLTNEQIADQLGFHDKRAISRINGQIYAAWGLDQSTTDEKVARTRTTMIVMSGRLLVWQDDGTPMAMNSSGYLLPWTGNER